MQTRTVGKPVTYASARERDGVSLLVLHIPDAVLWEIDATRDEKKIDLAICNRVRKGEARPSGEAAPGGLSM